VLLAYILALLSLMAADMYSSVLTSSASPLPPTAGRRCWAVCWCAEHGCWRVHQRGESEGC
jgi:hypothetical protein